MKNPNRLLAFSIALLAFTVMGQGCDTIQNLFTNPESVQGPELYKDTPYEAAETAREKAKSETLSDTAKPFDISPSTMEVIKNECAYYARPVGLTDAEYEGAKFIWKVTGGVVAKESYSAFYVKCPDGTRPEQVEVIITTADGSKQAKVTWDKSGKPTVEKGNFVKK